MAEDVVILENSNKLLAELFMRASPLSYSLVIIEKILYIIGTLSFFLFIDHINLPPWVMGFDENPPGRYCRIHGIKIYTVNHIT